MAVDTHIFRVANRTGLGARQGPARSRAETAEVHAAGVPAARAPLADPARALHLRRAQAEVPGVPDPGSLRVQGKDKRIPLAGMTLSVALEVQARLLAREPGRQVFDVLLLQLVGEGLHDRVGALARSCSPTAPSRGSRRTGRRGSGFPARPASRRRRRGRRRRLARRWPCRWPHCPPPERVAAAQREDEDQRAGSFSFVPRPRGSRPRGRRCPCRRGSPRCRASTDGCAAPPCRRSARSTGRSSTARRAWARGRRRDRPCGSPECRGSPRTWRFSCAPPWGRPRARPAGRARERPARSAAATSNRANWHFRIVGDSEKTGRL